jgi:hypothetical protein
MLQLKLSTEAGVLVAGVSPCPQIADYNAGQMQNGLQRLDSKAFDG